MTRTSSGALLTLVGVLALRAGLTDAMLQFLRPGMRPWLIAAAVIVCLLGVVQIVTGRRGGAPDPDDDGHADADGHTHNLRVGWLLVLPLCVGLLAPAALDAYSAQRSVAFSQRQWDLRRYDVEKLLSAEAIAGGTPQLPLVDYLGATTNAQSRDFLVTHPVSLEGFVVRDTEGDGHGFFLTRFFIGCCAADAIPLRLYVRTTQTPPPDNEWIRATVTLDRDRATVAATAHAQATLDSLQGIKKPSEPYEYP
jgi:uncharacterized repeat protein (TIGR03943 family)